MDPQSSLEVKGGLESHSGYGIRSAGKAVKCEESVTDFESRHGDQHLYRNLGT